MNLRKVLTIARYEYRTHFRRFGYLFATFGLPLLGALILFAGRLVSQQVGIGELLLGDLDNKPIAVYDTLGLLPPDLPEPFIAVDDPEAAKARVRQGEWLALVVFDEGLTQRNIVTAYTAENSATAIERLDTQVTALTAYLRLQPAYSFTEVKRLIQGPVLRFINLGPGQAEEGPGGGLNFLVGLVLSILFYVVLFSSAGYLLQSVAQEKESRIIEILLSSATSMELLWGKVLGLAALGLTQVAVWIGGVNLTAQYLARESSMVGVALRAFKSMLTHLPPQWVLAIGLILPASYLLYGVLMAGLGSLGNNMRESQQFAAAISMFAALPFMFNVFFSLNPNGIVPRALSYFPFTAPSATILRLAFTTLPWWDFGLILGITLVSTVLAVWVGVRLFRVGVLLSGKTPSWREVWLIIRNPG